MITKLKENETPEVWIQTVNGTVYSGKKPKDLNLQEDYQIILEQLKYYTGNIDALEETLDSNRWFTLDKIRPLLNYYKKNILPDEPLNAGTFAFVEKRLLERARQHELAAKSIATSASLGSVSEPVVTVPVVALQERKESQETHELKERKDVQENKESKEALERILTHYQKQRHGKAFKDSKENRLSEKLKHRPASAESQALIMSKAKPAKSAKSENKPPHRPKKPSRDLKGKT